jgi:hypothetical protein
VNVARVELRYPDHRKAFFVAELRGVKLEQLEMFAPRREGPPNGKNP